MIAVPKPRDGDDDEPELAMQVRCLNCLREQYALAVLPVSYGDAACVWCGVKSKPMSDAEYRNALYIRRLRLDDDKT